MNTSNVVKLNSLNEEYVYSTVVNQASQQANSSGSTHSNIITNSQHVDYGGVSASSASNNCILTYPYYTYTYGENVLNKTVVTKAENGFVLVFNTKTYIAKNEQEVAKLIVKVMSENNNK
jgi:hypothetical protein